MVKVNCVSGLSLQSFMEHFDFASLNVSSGMVPLACAILSGDLQKLVGVLVLEAEHLPNFEHAFKKHLQKCGEKWLEIDGIGNRD